MDTETAISLPTTGAIVPEAISRVSETRAVESVVEPKRTTAPGAKPAPSTIKENGPGATIGGATLVIVGWGLSSVTVAYAPTAGAARLMADTTMGTGAGIEGAE